MNPLVNQLYYELSGTVFNSGIYRTPDGSGQINLTEMAAWFGPNVDGFVNTSRTTGNADEATVPENFLKGLKSGQIGDLATRGHRVLVCSVRWPDAATQPINVPPTLQEGLNPWRYVVRDATHNPVHLTFGLMFESVEKPTGSTTGASSPKFSSLFILVS